jgi:signal transduction histidine kinase
VGLENVTLDNSSEAIEALLQFATLVERERKLLAADLHDQTLSDLRELARLARQLADMPEQDISLEVRSGLTKILEGLEAAMDEVRRAMENLTPSALDTLGLMPAIEGCLGRASACAERPFATRFACLINEDEIRITEIEQLMLYRIIQEALNNISKHAAARSVEIVIKKLGHDMLIRVVDDGKGLIASGELRRARGLDNMRYRARLIGAKLTWLRAVGESGTVVELRIPLRR